VVIAYSCAGCNGAKYDAAEKSVPAPPNVRRLLTLDSLGGLLVGEGLYVGGLAWVERRVFLRYLQGT
jgi:hypothetical protein